jgi:hypothetical protein
LGHRPFCLGRESLIAQTSETVNPLRGSAPTVPLSQWMQMISMAKWHRWQTVVAAATYASVKVMVNSSSYSASGSHLEYFAEGSPESIYQRLELVIASQHNRSGRVPPQI